MKKIITTAIATIIFTVTSNAQLMVTNLSSAAIPQLLEDYVENPPMEEVAETFIPEDLEVFSFMPEDFIEYDVDVAPGISEEELAEALESFQSELSDYARKFLGTKYVWGAKGPRAFDCSGFTGYVFKNFGYNIGGNSREQATRGQKVDIKEARVGDLMFFSRPRGGKTVGHVGMVIDVDPDNGTLKFIHASTKKGVTIQQFPDSGHYNRRFLQVRRVIDEDKLV